MNRSEETDERPGAGPSLNALHVIRNPELYGFAGEQESTFQTIKELVDNSIDAIRQRQLPVGTGRGQSVNRRSEIRIEIQDHKGCNNRLSIDVSDNGRGLRDIKELLKCFSSSKVRADESVQTDQEMNTTGKFGVGLTCILLHSCLNIPNEKLRIITKPYEVAHSMLTEFSVDPASLEAIETKHIRVIIPDFECGTKVKVSIPYECADQFPLAVVLSPLHCYLQKLSLLAYLEVHIFVMVQTRCTVSSISYHPPNASSARDPLCRGLRSRLDEYFASPLQCLHCVESEVQVPDSNFRVIINIALVFEDTSGIVPGHEAADTAKENLVDFDADDPDSIQEEQKENYAENSGELELLLWRYANGAPLLDRHNDAMACALTVALQSVRWTQFGFKLQLQTSDPDVVYHNKSAAASEQLEGDSKWLLSTHTHLLMPMRKFMLASEAATMDLMPSKLIVIANVVGASVPYATPLKSFLGASNADTLIGRAAEGIEEALGAMKERCAQCPVAGPHKLLRSVTEQKEEDIERVCIPAVARAVCRITQLSPEPAFQSRVLRSLFRAEASLGITPAATAAPGASAAGNGADPDTDSSARPSLERVDTAILRPRLQKVILETFRRKKG